MGGQTMNNRQRKTSLHPTKEEQHLKQSPLYSHFSFETWAQFPLSQLVTPTQAIRCKEIQYSLLPTGRRAFFCPNQDKSPCILLASPSRLGTRNIWFTRWLRTPSGPNADTSLIQLDMESSLVIEPKTTSIDKGIFCWANPCRETPKFKLEKPWDKLILEMKRDTIILHNGDTTHS
jgi:hypothetical protein